MYSEPRDLDRAALADALKRHWNMGLARLDYLPVGFGSHHSEAVGDRAFRTAAALRDDAGLEFVVAPIPSDGGPALRRIDARYAIRVEPFVDGAARDEFERPEERRRMGTLLAACTPRRGASRSAFLAVRTSHFRDESRLGRRLTSSTRLGTPGRSLSRPESCCGRTRAESGNACALTISSPGVSATSQARGL